MRTTRKLSDETKEKISTAMKGYRNPNYGKVLPPQHREKIKQAMLKYWSTIPQ